jgi:hypothetical protein
VGGSRTRNGRAQTREMEIQNLGSYIPHARFIARGTLIPQCNHGYFVNILVTTRHSPAETKHPTGGKGYIGGPNRTEYWFFPFKEWRVLHRRSYLQIVQREVANGSPGRVRHPCLINSCKVEVPQFKTDLRIRLIRKPSETGRRT